MDELHHECGIAAIYHLHHPTASRLAPLAGQEQVSRLMPRMLLDMQNRGQLAAGFSTFDPHREKILDTYKQIGTVIEADLWRLGQAPIGSRVRFIESIHLDKSPDVKVRFS